MHPQIMIAQRITSGGGAVTFDPAKKGVDAVLSGGNLTLNAATATATALATAGYTTGSRYWEFLCSAKNIYSCFGIARVGGATNLNTDLGQEAGEYAWGGFGGSYFAGTSWGVSGPAINAGDVVGIAVNFNTRRMWVHVNGTYITGNPSTNTGPIVTYASGLGTIYAAASVVSPGDTVVFRPDAGAFSYPIPTGFSAYG